MSSSSSTRVSRRCGTPGIAEVGYGLGWLTIEIVLLGTDNLVLDSGTEEKLP